MVAVSSASAGASGHSRSATRRYARPSVREASRSAGLGVLAAQANSTSSVGRPATARDRHTAAVAASVSVTVSSRVRQYPSRSAGSSPPRRAGSRPPDWV